MVILHYAITVLLAVGFAYQHGNPAEDDNIIGEALARKAPQPHRNFEFDFSPENSSRFHSYFSATKTRTHVKSTSTVGIQNPSHGAVAPANGANANVQPWMALAGVGSGFFVLL